MTDMPSIGVIATISVAMLPGTSMAIFAAFDQGEVESHDILRCDNSLALWGSDTGEIRGEKYGRITFLAGAERYDPSRRQPPYRHRRGRRAGGGCAGNTASQRAG